MSNIFKVYLVKSFGPYDGYTNLEVYSTLEAAEQYADDLAKLYGVKRDTDDDCQGSDEFIEVEELDYIEFSKQNDKTQVYGEIS
jgi:hypothetical protein